MSVSAPVAESAGVAGKEDEREMGRRRQEVSPRPALVLEVPLATPSPQIQETSKRAGSWSRRRQRKRQSCGPRASTLTFSLKVEPVQPRPGVHASCMTLSVPDTP